MRADSICLTTIGVLEFGGYTMRGSSESTPNPDGVRCECASVGGGGGVTLCANVVYCFRVLQGITWTLYDNNTILSRLGSQDMVLS